MEKVSDPEPQDFKHYMTTMGGGGTQVPPNTLTPIDVDFLNASARPTIMSRDFSKWADKPGAKICPICNEKKVFYICLAEECENFQTDKKLFCMKCMETG